MLLRRILRLLCLGIVELDQCSQMCWRMCWCLLRRRRIAIVLFELPCLGPLRMLCFRWLLKVARRDFGFEEQRHRQRRREVVHCIPHIVVVGMLEVLGTRYMLVV